MSTIAVVGTLDTKGEEHAFVAEIIRQRGHEVLLIDVGTMRPPSVSSDISRERVAESAGVDLERALANQDRGEAVRAMSEALPRLLESLVERAEIDGVIALGGGGGTAIATAGMRALPVGFPKLMVSTLASGNTAHYIDVKDIVLMPSVVDVAGLNRISRVIFARAAGAICGMVEVEVPQSDLRPIIAATQFGNTTACVDRARQRIEERGYEPLVFHATGVGGRTMESLITSGLITAVLDVTTTEWADEIVGGVLRAGAERMEAAARAGLPTVVAPGCLDMVNFGSPESVPPEFEGRLFYEHNPQVTLMRTTPEECACIGKMIAEKLNLSVGPVAMMIPTRAISIISAEGQSFHHPEADEALFESLRANLRDDIPFIELDLEINDPEFADACVEKLFDLMERAR